MKKLLTGLSLVALAACSGEPEQPQDLAATANRITAETIIVDGHIDVPYRMNDAWINVAGPTADGDFDYPRAVSGGLNAPFMSIYTPAVFDGTPMAKAHAERMIALVERMETDAPEKFAIARTVADLEAAFFTGKIALPLGMENGAPIMGDLANLDYFFERGIRYITLTHSRANHISDSSYDENKVWGGLSDFGKQVVAKMNDLGIMVDVSHISDEAYWDVMEITKTPVIASHSSARHFTPGFERNMNDEMIKALATNGSVIMINYGSSFVTEEANQYRPKRAAAYEAHLAENNIEDSDEVRAAFVAEYQKTTPYPYATLEQVLDHFDHVVRIAGINHVGIGSDYDGVGDSLPIGLKDVSSYPALAEGLLRRGYSEEDVKKVLSGNVLRVWRTVEAYAASQQS
ncbi:MAG: dipeptidase [Kordiimonadaceae bacterium]|nr:dipeptidase [Kordiimonadaceae bacterium]MBO6567243.1 dipeptidase [Kordiimonadaceae bacterium]MBO6963543.1 dipeptidase [Kordiimonadaceae bacterium]